MARQNEKYTFGTPKKKCCICKTMTSNMVGTVYNHGNPNLDAYAITTTVAADFDAAVKDYQNQLPNIGSYSNGKRLNLWKLSSNVTVNWSWQLRHILTQSFGLKSFREDPTYDKFKARVEKEKDKITKSYTRERVGYQKTYVCSEACFNLWLLKNKEK